MLFAVGIAPCSFRTGAKNKERIGRTHRGGELVSHLSGLFICGDCPGMVRERAVTGKRLQSFFEGGQPRGFIELEYDYVADHCNILPYPLRCGNSIIPLKPNVFALSCGAAQFASSASLTADGSSAVLDDARNARLHLSNVIHLRDEVRPELGMPF